LEIRKGVFEKKTKIQKRLFRVGGKGERGRGAIKGGGQSIERSRGKKKEIQSTATKSKNKEPWGKKKM